MPADRIEIRIEVTGPESRQFEIVSIGPKYAEAIRQLHERFSTSWGGS